MERRGGTPQERLLTIFDVFDEWFHRDDYEGCLFTRCLLETHDRTSSIGAASVAGLDEVRAHLAGLASEAEIPVPEDFAGRWQTLMLGAIIAADTGNLEAAKGAGRVGAVLLDLDGVAS